MTEPSASDTSGSSDDASSPQPSPSEDGPAEPAGPADATTSPQADPTVRMQPVAGPSEPGGGPSALRGVVTAAGTGAPVDGAEVEVAGRDGQIVGRATTVADGRFSVVQVPAGDYRLTVSRSGFFATRRQVDHGGRVQALELELVHAELLGQVRAESSGEPVLDARAKLRSTDGALVGQSLTDPEGRFLIPLAGLATAGSTGGATHHLEVTADGFEPVTIDLALTDVPAAELSVALAATKRSPWPWVGLAAAVLLLLALLFALFSGDDTTVPDLVGATIVEAADMLEGEGLLLGEVTFSDADPEAEPGTVLGSDPEAGATAQVGDAVDLTAAADPVEDPTVEVPRVTGRQESDAVRLLDALRFDVAIARVASDEAAGIVVAQVPEPRTEVPVGAEVRIDISQGPGEEPGAEQPAPESEDPGQEPAEPEPGEPEPTPGAEDGTGDGEGLQLPDIEVPEIEVPDLELPDVEVPGVDTEEVRGLIDRIVDWIRNAFNG